MHCGLMIRPLRTPALTLTATQTAGKATESVLFTSAAPAVASPAEWPPTATALAGDEEVTLADARSETLGTPKLPVRGASGCGSRKTRVSRGWQQLRLG